MNCPFCATAAGAEPEFTAWRDSHVLVRISKKWYSSNPGHALVIPLAHHENIYALPDDLAGRIARMARRVASAMRRGYPCRRPCARTTSRLAATMDEIWHLHTHVIPRHTGDDLRGSRFGRADDSERARYAVLLRESLTSLDEMDGAP